MPRVLMVAYHFPPHSGTSGVQRALRFSSYLPEFGWDPIVLTANPGVYDHCSPDLDKNVRDDIEVIRAPALETRRHFSIRGRYPAFLARPDRWWCWWLGAIPAGLMAIRRYKPDIIWSTYPIATAHRIGCTLARLSRLPLVADFRDPMAQDGYPPDPATWRSFERIERRTVNMAARVVFTTPSARECYRQRYPQHGQGFVVIENGYDEEAFADAESMSAPLHPDKITLLHSGVIYPNERDPNALFIALARLKQAQPGLYGKLVFRFRASMAEELVAGLADRHGVSSAIEVKPPVPYRDAISEMQAADGLVILQGANCNAQIPAKIYEYLRARRPLIVFGDPAGDTAGVAKRAGVETIAPLENPDAIYSLLIGFLAGESQSMPSREAVSGASRLARTEELAAVLRDVNSGCQTPRF